jgi:hypothetical protein
MPEPGFSPFFAFFRTTLKRRLIRAHRKIPTHSFSISNVSQAFQIIAPIP